MRQGFNVSLWADDLSLVPQSCQNRALGERTLFNTLIHAHGMMFRREGRWRIQNTFFLI